MESIFFAFFWAFVFLFSFTFQFFTCFTTFRHLTKKTGYGICIGNEKIQLNFLGCKCY